MNRKVPTHRKVYATLSVFFGVFLTMVSVSQAAHPDRPYLKQSLSSPERTQEMTEKIIKSRNKPVIFLELYTSQGCYSCPPAERWINKFADSGLLWNEIIPVNFHVDYWDYLGWKDPFSRAEFSNRQRKYRHFRHTRNVATPGFVVNGRGWDSWFFNRRLPQAKNIKEGELEIKLKGDEYAIDFDPSSSLHERLNVHVAILGFGVETKIPKGENAGKTLEHDFVVVGYRRARLERGEPVWSKALTKPEVVAEPTTKEAIVFWVTGADDPAPLQVAADWL